MAKTSEISSTERLLELIRDKGDRELQPSATFPPSFFSRRLKAPFSKVLSFRKAVTVGVDIGTSALKLVKVGEGFDKTQKLLDYLEVPFESDISRDSPRFPHFLNSVLAGFCGTSGKIEIWSAISSIRVEMRYLRIPRVPKKQIPNAVYWTYKKEVSFDEKKDVFDFELLGDIVEDGTPKTEVISYTAPRQEIEQLKGIFSKSGFPLTGITIVPFAIQNLLRTQLIEPDEKNVCSLFIGSDWSRIAIFSDRNLVLSRDIKAGMQSLIETIREAMDEKQAALSMQLADTDGSKALETSGKESPITTDPARKIFFDFIKGSSSPEKVGAFDSKEKEIFKLVCPALERLVRQVERTIEHYSLKFGNERVGKLYISGEISTHKGIVDHIGNQLGLPVDTIDPFASGSSFLGEVSPPPSAAAREALVPAAGMALSNNSRTPNFIFTYKDKEKLKTVSRINRTLFMVFLICISLCIGVAFWQSHLVDRKKAQLTALQQQLEKYSPYIDEARILQLVARTKHKSETLKALGKRYAGMAVINEISNMTPPRIRLLSITANLGAVAGTKDKAEKKFLLLDGIIFGSHLTFDASLAGYLVKLKSSPIFEEPIIKKKSLEFLGDREVLHFTAELKLV